MVNDNGPTKWLQQWILFITGWAMIAGFGVRWWQTGGDVPIALGGLAVILVGLGDEVAKRLGKKD